MPVLRRLRIGGAMLLLTLGVGTVGYRIIEGWPLVDALFVTVLVVSTLGFGELRPTGILAQLFTMLIILAGVGTLYYLVGALAQTLIESQLGRQERVKTEHRVTALRNHYIVCGFGRVGQQICRALARERCPFVVIDSDPERIKRIHRAGYLAMRGDATNDDDLRHAGIERARCLITAVATDAANVYVTLSARALNPLLFIVARAGSTEAEHKLETAGANRVVSPYVLGGQRMASLALRPTVIDFLDVITHGDNVELWLEEMRVGEESSLVGVMIGEADLRARAGVNILAIRRADGTLLVNPDTGTLIQVGDILIILGAQDEVRRLAN